MCLITMIPGSLSMSRIDEIKTVEQYFDLQADLAFDEARETHEYDPEHSQKMMRISNAAFEAKFAILDYLKELDGNPR